MRLAKLNAPCAITATLAEGDKPARPPTFSALAYSGGPVAGHTLTPPIKGEYVIDLSGMKAGKNIKANLDHKSTQRVGHLTDSVNDGKQLFVSGALSAATSHQAEVVGSAANGFEWEVSIEAGLGNPRKLESGKTATVNGRELTGPLLIFGKSTLTALGFVSNGADEGNSVTIAATAAGANTMSKFDEFVASCGADPETITTEHRARLQKLYDLEQSGSAGGAAKTFTQVVEEERRENSRQEAITTMSRDAMREQPQAIDRIEALAREAIESKMSAKDFELDLLRAMRTRSGTFSSRLGTQPTDPRMLEAAICMASGLPNVEKHYSEATLEAVDRSGMRNGFSLQQCLLQAAHANGYSCRPGERIHVGNIRSVLEYCFPPVTARMSGFSTAALPNILGAVANKMILAGYMESDQSWTEIASTKPVSNFYTQNHFRMLDSLEYEEVGSGGEIQHGSLGEETYTSQAKTYGKMLGLTRTQIINDDLGAFGDIRERLGRGAAKKFNNVFWAAFMNNSSFFTSGRGNYITGATSNLGTDNVGLGEMLAAFRIMATPAADGSKKVGNDMNPTKIIVPPELETNAMIVYRNTNLGAVANSSANIYQGRFRPVVQWRLSNSSYTGYGAKIWYMFGDEVRPMLVTLLNGNATPIVESTDADFNTLGIQFRGYHDFGCDKSEYLAGCKSKGEA